MLKQQMLKQKEESKIIKRGSLVKYDSKLYLIYGEFKDNWQAYLIYTVNSKLDNSLALNISNTKFFTLFETILIPKDDNLRTDKFASEEEMDKIKYLKKSVKTINNQNYIPYKTTTKNNLLSLSKQQEILVLKLKALNYNKNEVIAIMIKLNQKYQIEELLDYFVKLEKEYDKIDKETVTQKITQMLRNIKTQY